MLPFICTDTIKSIKNTYLYFSLILKFDYVELTILEGIYLPFFKIYMKLGDISNLIDWACKGSI